MGLRKLDAHLQGHPDMTRTPGIEVSTGSLGQGLSMSLGISLALRLDGIDAHVFTLLSDGDCQEGQTWEAATAAVHFRVANLTAIVDYNHLQTDGTTEEVMDIGDVRAKFGAFGWDTVEIDGHDMAAVVEALEWAGAGRRPRPSCARRARAVRLADGGPVRLRQPPTPEQAEQAGRAGADPRRPGRDAGAVAMSPVLDRDPVATRVAYGDALVELGEQHEDVVALDADLAVSTMSIKFGRKFPRQFFNVGAAGEHDVDGLQASRRPARCRTRPRRDLRHRPRLRPGAARHRPQAPVRVCASHGGLSLGEDGASTR